MPESRWPEAHWTRTQLSADTWDITFQPRPVVDLHATAGEARIFGEDLARQAAERYAYGDGSQPPT